MAEVAIHGDIDCLVVLDRRCLGAVWSIYPLPWNIFTPKHSVVAIFLVSYRVLHNVLPEKLGIAVRNALGISMALETSLTCILSTIVNYVTMSFGIGSDHHAAAVFVGDILDVRRWNSKSGTQVGTEWTE
jgi:hypothetical protein